MKTGSDDAILRNRTQPRSNLFVQRTLVMDLTFRFACRMDTRSKSQRISMSVERLRTELEASQQRQNRALKEVLNPLASAINDLVKRLEDRTEEKAARVSSDKTSGDKDWTAALRKFEEAEREVVAENKREEELSRAIEAARMERKKKTENKDSKMQHLDEAIEEARRKRNETNRDKELDKVIEESRRQRHEKILQLKQKKELEEREAEENLRREMQKKEGDSLDRKIAEARRKRTLREESSDTEIDSVSHKQSRRSSVLSIRDTRKKKRSRISWNDEKKDAVPETTSRSQRSESSSKEKEPRVDSSEKVPQLVLLQQLRKLTLLSATNEMMEALRSALPPAIAERIVRKGQTGTFLPPLAELLQGGSLQDPLTFAELQAYDELLQHPPKCRQSSFPFFRSCRTDSIDDSARVESARAALVTLTPGRTRCQWRPTSFELLPEEMRVLTSKEFKPLIASEYGWADEALLETLWLELPQLAFLMTREKVSDHLGFIRARSNEMKKSMRRLTEDEKMQKRDQLRQELQEKEPVWFDAAFRRLSTTDSRTMSACLVFNVGGRDYTDISVWGNNRSPALNPMTPWILKTYFGMKKNIGRDEPLDTWDLRERASRFMTKQLLNKCIPMT